MKAERLAILDAGGQYVKVIDRKCRELSAESVILPFDTPAEELAQFQALILSGGPESVYADNAPSYDQSLFRLGIPVLGICYGMQLINFIAGGEVGKTGRREDGPCEITIDPNSTLFRNLSPLQQVLMSHGDSVTNLAPGFQATAFSDGLIAAIENPESRLYGVQFHPEVSSTAHGQKILHNFLYEIAGFSGNFSIEDREIKAIDYIQQSARDREVLVLVSGGVDSTVCATLLAKALPPERIHALHVDNGFMRWNESCLIAKALEKIGINLRVVSAAEEFYGATTNYKGNQTKPLREVIHPEEKRTIIGDQFMRVAQREIEILGLSPRNVILAQGTLRPDLIESASRMATLKGGADTIKTHHNDTPLVRLLRDEGLVIEPLSEYHKDEVRALGEILGLPEEVVWRQPFPGPGLAIRIICAHSPYITTDFDQINQRLKEYNDSEITATLLPVQTVGVQGDGRTYSYLAALSGKADWDKLSILAREIPKGIHGVNRVVYLFGNRVNGPVTDITPTTLTRETIEQLRLADHLANQILAEYGLMRTISQDPITSFPVNFGIPGNRSIGERPFLTPDYMTGRPALPGIDIPIEAAEKTAQAILTKVPGISRVAYDLTPKPPGTIEWE